MMGLSWQTIAKKENVSKSTILDRCSTYLGDICVKYNYDINGLTEEYRDCWKENDYKRAQDVYTNSEFVTTITQDNFEKTEELAYEYVMRSISAEALRRPWEECLKMTEKEFIEGLYTHPELKNNPGHVAMIISYRQEAQIYGRTDG